MKINSPSK
ncbi:hypothetical protein YPPY66_3610, partial [Yersinia pestis PY-66]